MKATAACILDTRREKKNETYPIRLRIIYNRRPKYYATGEELSKTDWDKLTSGKARNELKDLKFKLTTIEKYASDIIDDITYFSFEEFEKRYQSKKVKKDRKNVYTAFTDYIQSLEEEGRVTTAMSYGNALSSLQKFRKELIFDEVTPDFLHQYDSWMLQQGKSLTTIGFYLRSLRTIINEALEAGLIQRDQYPFGKRKYTIPKGKNTKKALTLTQIEQIYNYQVIYGTTEALAKDLWLFSYLCNGMNIKDICRLKGKNISNGKITFYRAKTERTSRTDPKPIVVILTPEAQAIIDRVGNKDITADNFVFPFLNDCEDPKRERQIINQVTKNINTYMKRIAKELGIEIKLTTYVARHSFSTVLKRSGAPIEFISEALGHQDTKTTDHYLDSFEDSVKQQYSQSLLAFNKKE